MHATFYGGRPYRLQSEQRLVSSLFDLTPERHPEHFLLPQIRSPHANKRGWLATSDLILSISQASADDLCFFQPGVQQHVKVIHLATRIDSVSPQAVDQLVGKRFWLMVGKRYAYKNGLTLFLALQRMPQTSQQPLLVCAGGGEWSRKELELIHSARLTNKVLQIPSNDQQLAWLYRNAEAVLVPSMAEGFSLPLIEALVCNAPLIASDLEAHREIASRYAILIPALNATTWAEILNKASENRLPRPSATLGEAEYIRLCAYYGIDRMASEHLQAYQKII